MQNLLNNLKILTPNDKVVIGVSGGEDSMCLLHVLINNINKENIIVAHVNHNIRKESKDELLFVQKYCEDNAIKFVSTVLPNDKKYNENELRQMRYAFFDDVIKANNANYLLTAHHGDDLIETILMRITRGSSLKGYAGMEMLSKKKDYQIFRPLLNVSKESITNYIKENNIPFVIDKSNEKDEYTRNRYRHYIIPKLKEENNKVNEKYYNFSKELIRYYEFVDKLVKEDIELNGFPKYNLTNFNEKDELLKRKIIEKLLDMFYGNDIAKLNNQHVDDILKITSKTGNTSLDLPLNKKIIKEYNYLSIVDNKVENTNIKVELKEKYENNYFVIETQEKTDDNSNYTIKLNSEEINKPLYIRSIKNGDKMAVKNLNGHKKIKDILIDEKISKSKRDNLVVVTDSNDEILWLPGIKKSKFDKSKQEKYDIIIKYSEKVSKEGEII